MKQSKHHKTKCQQHETRFSECIRVDNKRVVPAKFPLWDFQATQISQSTGQGHSHQEREDSKIRTQTYNTDQHFYDDSVLNCMDYNPVDTK